jgi:hypothetical protein
MAAGRANGAAKVLALAAILPLLGGCAAAVALPLLAGGTLYIRDKNVRVRAATPVQLLEQDVAVPDLASAPAAGSPLLTGLAELPAPPDRETPWRGFADHALAQAAMVRDGQRPLSALLQKDTSLLRADRRECVTRHPAVILDLDAAREAFDPAAGARAAAGLAEALQRLREDKIIVLWTTQLPAARAGEVARALRAAGLDPEGADQLLLVRGPEDRKQVLREQANEDVCVVALAGDERTDFDELFDYLRDPAAGIGLDEMLGNGWFLTPQPLAAPAP